MFRRIDWCLVAFIATIVMPVVVFFASESQRAWTQYEARLEAAMCCCRMAHCWCGHPPSKGDR